MQSYHVSGLGAERLHQWCFWCDDTDHSGDGSNWMNYWSHSFSGCVGSISKLWFLFHGDSSSQSASVKGQSNAFKRFFSCDFFFWKVAKNVVPNARGLALAVRQHLETMLSNLPAPDSTVEPSGCRKPDQIQPKTDAGMPTMVRGQALFCYGMLFPCRAPNPRFLGTLPCEVAIPILRDSPTAAAFSASASAMEPLIAKNREKLRHAQKTGDGTMAGSCQKLLTKCIKNIVCTMYGTWYLIYSMLIYNIWIWYLSYDMCYMMHRQDRLCLPILFYSILCCAMLCYSILIHSVQCYSVLVYSIFIFYSILFYAMLW